MFVVARGLSRSLAYGTLVPQPGVEPASPALGRQILDPWTTREVPYFKYINSMLSLLFQHLSTCGQFLFCFCFFLIPYLTTLDYLKQSHSFDYISTQSGPLKNLTDCLNSPVHL